MGKYSKYNTKYSDEFLDDKKKKGYPLSMFLGDKYANEEYYKKHNLKDENINSKVNNLRDEGFCGRSMDKFLDDIEMFNEDD